MKHHKAPWSKSLIVVSTFATVLCLGISFWARLKHASGPAYWLGLLPLTFVAGCALYTVRGYTVTPDAILVHRLLWATRLPLAGLESACFEPEAMRCSIRTFGNGGFFSFTGFYSNKRLGTYRAFVTDPSRVVVLRYSKRTMVVSPAAPEEFVRELAIPNAASASAITH